MAIRGGPAPNPLLMLEKCLYAERLSVFLSSDGRAERMHPLATLYEGAHKS
jgi:hypothetical protein